MLAILPKSPLTHQFKYVVHYYLSGELHAFKGDVKPPIRTREREYAAYSCPTELISQYLDQIMSPFVKSLPSYIKDTNHALKTFRDFNFQGQNKLIFTMDITSLYTVIPNHEGLLALKKFFHQRANKEPSTETLIRLAELVLTLNCFSFSETITSK